MNPENLAVTITQASADSDKNKQVDKKVDANNINEGNNVDIPSDINNNHENENNNDNDNNTKKSYVKHFLSNGEWCFGIPIRVMVMLLGLIAWIFDWIIIMSPNYSQFLISWMFYFTYFVIISLIIIPITFAGLIKDWHLICRICGEYGRVIKTSFGAIICVFLFVDSDICNTICDCDEYCDLIICYLSCTTDQSSAAIFYIFYIIINEIFYGALVRFSKFVKVQTN